MTIEPDFTIGPNANDPHTVLLVTHSSSTKNSDMKFWRNIGELAEAKTLLPTHARVYNVMFDSKIKEDLKGIQGTAFDGQLIVGDRVYGESLQRWVDKHAPHLPQDGEAKASAILNLLGNKKSADGLYELTQSLISDLDTLLGSARP